MAERPERIWIWGSLDKWHDRGWTDSSYEDSDTGYVRADIHRQCVDVLKMVAAGSKDGVVVPRAMIREAIAASEGSEHGGH